MFAKEWLPWVIEVEQPASADSLDILVKTSDDDSVLAMYVINYGIQSQERDLNIKNFSADKNVKVTQLGPHPFTARNSGENPNLITPVVNTKKIGKKKFNHEFPGHSFTVIRLQKK